MKLEIKHLAPYLPYGLKMKSDEGTMIYKVKGINISEQFWILIKDKNGFDCQITNVKPILRPLSDLNKFDTSTWQYEMKSKVGAYENDITCMRYSDVIDLIEQHYDVFGLIEKGLAIDINTL